MNHDRRIARKDRRLLLWSINNPLLSSRLDHFSSFIFFGLRSGGRRFLPARPPYLQFEFFSSPDSSEKDERDSRGLNNLDRVFSSQRRGKDFVLVICLFSLLMNDPSQMSTANFGFRQRPIEDPLSLGRRRPIFFTSSPNPGRSNRKFFPRKFYHKRKSHRFTPLAPLNTTSFLIRAKKSGGIASLVSPCPLTPAILPTPKLSPSREFLVDMAKEEWGVDGYGSMNGLIRLRCPHRNEEEVDEGSSGSDVEERVDLSRFEMVYPGAKIAHLEEENLTLKERLFIMQREMRDLSRRLRRLETRRRGQRNVDLRHCSSSNNAAIEEDDACN